MLKNINWKTVSIITIIVITVTLFSCFFLKKFDASDDNFYNKWIALTAILTPIFSLLAFVGVLLNQNQLVKTEERAEYNDLFKLYIQQKENISIDDKKGMEAFNKLADKVRSLMLSTILFYDIKNSENEEKLLNTITIFKNKGIKKLYIQIKNGKDYDTLKKEFNILEQISDEKIRDIVPEDILKNDEMLIIRMISEMNKTNSSEAILYCGYQMHELENNNKKAFSEVLSMVADMIYNDNATFLGQYYRTIYYLLENILEFRNKEKYEKIFRAQLSNDELVLIFINAFSSKSTTKTIQMYKEVDLFNNLTRKELNLAYRDYHDTEFTNNMIELAYERLRLKI